MKKTKITLMLLIICQAVIAQTKTAEEVTEKRLERIEQTIDFSVEQRTNIEAIVLKSSSEILAMKASGEYAREDIVAIKKQERTLVKAQLTPEQLLALKAAKESNKAKHNQVKAERAKFQAAKQDLKAMRSAFDAKLSTEEKEVIEKARLLLPKRVKKTEKAELTPEEKEERKAIRMEIKNLLAPVIATHQAELDQIKSTTPTKRGKNESTPNNGFYHKFLLMK